MPVSHILQVVSNLVHVWHYQKPWAFFSIGCLFILNSFLFCPIALSFLPLKFSSLMVHIFLFSEKCHHLRIISSTLFSNNNNNNPQAWHNCEGQQNGGFYACSVLASHKPQSFCLHWNATPVAGIESYGSAADQLNHWSTMVDKHLFF